MAIREILVTPNPILKQVSSPVTVFDDALKILVADMFETMYDAPGIGLAAVQIGVAKRLIVMDLAREGEPPAPRVFVNPEIVEKSAETKPWEEGCLSVPEFYEEVQRPARVTLRYQDVNGVPHEEIAEDLFAVCIQHEMDHLEGVLFIDHLSRLKRGRALDKVRKVVRERTEIA